MAALEETEKAVKQLMAGLPKPTGLFVSQQASQTVT